MRWCFWRARPKQADLKTGLRSFAALSNTQIARPHLTTEITAITVADHETLTSHDRTRSMPLLAAQLRQMSWADIRRWLSTSKRQTQ